MLNWYDMPGALDGFENDPAYLDKAVIDDKAEQNPAITISHGKIRSTCAWIEKRNYKKKMVRRFLSINPDMDYSKLGGTRCSPAIYLCFPDYNDGDFYDPKMIYNFNPHSRIFLSPRGDLRKYHGAVSVSPCRGSYALGHKDKAVSKITNRCLRHLATDEEVPRSYSYCKKLYGPMIDDLW